MLKLRRLYNVLYVNFFYIFFLVGFVRVNILSTVAEVPTTNYQLPNVPLSYTKVYKLLMMVNMIEPGVFIIALAAELFGFWDI